MEGGPFGGQIHAAESLRDQPEKNQFAVAAMNALTDFCFLWSSKTALQTATHSLHIHTRLERSDGFEMSVSTWSSVLLQNEHLRISSSWRLRNMSPVWASPSQSSRFAKVQRGTAPRPTALLSAEHRKMLPLGAKRLLAFGQDFQQSESPDSTEPTLARFSPVVAAPLFSRISGGR